MAIPHKDGDSYLNIARGESGFSYMHKFGHNPAATTGSVAVWSEGTAYSYLSAADYLICASDDTNDDGASTGARTVQIYGLDANYAEQNETITLDGFNAVTTTNQYLRVFRAIVRTAGTTGWNEGKVAFLPDAAGNTFTAAGVPTTTSNVLMAIQTTTNQTRMAIYTVPESITAHMVQAWGGCSNNQEIEFSIWTRPYGEVFQNKGQIHVYRNFVQYDPKIPIPIDAKTDIEIRSIASTTGADLSAGFNLVLINE